MQVKREGLNAASYEISESEIRDLGFDLCELKKANGLTEEIQELSNIFLEMFVQHVHPVFAMAGIPIAANLMFTDVSIEFVFEVHGVPFEVLDFSQNYDVELNINNCMTIEHEFGQEDDLCDISCEDIFECICAIKFKTFDDVMNYVSVCKNIKQYPKSSLYKSDKYYLICDFSNVEEDDTYRYENTSAEWGVDIIFENAKICHIIEHGKEIIEKNAFETLLKL